MTQLPDPEARAGAACVRELCGAVRAVLAKRPDLTPAERQQLEAALACGERLARRLDPPPEATKAGRP